MGNEIRTVRGYDLYEVASALQKSLRRNDGKSAGYWAIELLESGYWKYLWKRLLTVAAEDCAGVISTEIYSLFKSYELCVEGKKDTEDRTYGRIFAAKATLLLAATYKSRDSDHLTNFVYDKKALMPDSEIIAQLVEARKDRLDIPEYAFDIHTKRGRIMGRTKRDFFEIEQNALTPKLPGLFDDLPTKTQ